MTLLLGLFLAAAPLPPECEAPALRDVSALKSLAQRSGSLSVGLDSVATWCFDSGGTWTAGQKPKGKKKEIDAEADPQLECLKAVRSCEAAREAAPDTTLMYDAIKDLERPYLSRKYTPKRSGLQERPSEAADCSARVRSDLFTQAQARMDLARLAAIVQNEYGSYKQWLLTEGMKCAQAVRSGKVDPMRKGIGIDAPVVPDKGQQTLPKNASGTPAIPGSGEPEPAVAAADPAGPGAAGGSGGAGGRTPTEGKGGAAGTAANSSGGTNPAAGGATGSTGAGGTKGSTASGTNPAGSAGSGSIPTVAGTGGGTGAAPNAAGTGKPGGSSGTATAGTTTTGTTTAGTGTTGTGTAAATPAGSTVTATGPGGKVGAGTAGTTTPSSLVVPPVATPSTVATATPEASAPSFSTLLEKWRAFADHQARLELDRDYTLGFLASRELRECRCPRINPSAITNALRADAGVAQLAADDALNSRCEQCLLDAYSPWRGRADKQCQLMEQLSDYELSVLERSDDGNGLPPRCFEAVRVKRGGKPAAVPGTPVASAGTATVPSQPPAGKTVTLSTPPPAPATVTSPIADSFVRSQDYAPVPTREDGRLYVRIFMSSACVADVLPGPLQARTGDLLLIPLAAKQLSVRSPCGGLAEVYWGREERPRVSEIFGRNQPLQLQFKPQ